MHSNSHILTNLANAFRQRQGYHVTISFLFTQPGVPDFQVDGQLDVLFPGNLVFTTQNKDGLVTAAITHTKGFTRLNFPKAEAMQTPMPPSRSRISRCLSATSMFDDGLADVLSGFVPYGGDISLVRDAGKASINGFECAGYIVDIGKRTPMPSSVTVFIGTNDLNLYRYVTDHPTIKGAQRSVTFSSPQLIRELPKNPKVTDTGMQKMTAEPAFDGVVIVGRMAPPLAGQTLDGRAFDLDTPVKATARIVHFWSALDINSCLQVVDIANAIGSLPKGSVQVVSVCLDHVTTPQRIKAVWSRLGASWTTIIDPLGPDSDAARAWRTDTPGGIVILSRTGVVQSIGLRSRDITAAVVAASRMR